MLLQELGPLSENPAPLSLSDIPNPEPGEHELLLRVTICGVCHTELDEIEGRTPPPRLPIVLGHQVVGIIDQGDRAGQRVGVAWIHSACGTCEYCLSDRENLCADFRATGRDADGGYAEFMTVPAAFAYPIPPPLSDADAAPLLCAGGVGYRALKLTNIHDGDNLGLMGFGASNHLVLKTARHKYPKAAIFVFSRNPVERELALDLGATWAGTIEQTPPERLHAVIDATPAWTPIAQSLTHLRPGGRLVVNAIRKEEADKNILLKLDYGPQLWMEKEIKSVANVTRQDVHEFLQLAAEAQIKPEVQEYALEEANQALVEMKQGKIRGAKVLRVS